MSFLNRMKDIGDGVKNAALDKAQLVAQAASEGTRDTRDRVFEAVGDVAESFDTMVERRKLERLPETVVYLLENDTARMLLADSIASAETAANPNTTWDEILKAALLNLKATPLGGGK